MPFKADTMITKYWINKKEVTWPEAEFHEIGSPYVVAKILTSDGPQWVLLKEGSEPGHFVDEHPDWHVLPPDFADWLIGLMETRI